MWSQIVPQSQIEASHKSCRHTSPSLEPACPITDLSPLTPLLAQAGHCDVASPDAPQTLHVNGHMVISKCGVAGNGKPGCKNNSCMYGGGQGAVDYDHIYDCKQCSGPASSSICARCLLNGGTCEPGHDQWELLTWTVYIWVFVILSPLYRPTFHSRIPEWRTVFIFYFILFYMGSYVCYMYHGSLQ